MAASLIEHGAVRTTEAKAKELRGFIERMITLAKSGSLHARRQVIAELGDRGAWAYNEAQKEYEQENRGIVQKLFDDIARRYVDRPGGYTRIIRLAERRIGDAGSQVILQLLEEETKAKTGQDTGAAPSRRKRRAAKRHKATGDTRAAEPEEEPAEAEQDQPAEDAEQGDQPADQQADPGA